MIAAILIFFAAVCNAIMDRLENEPAFNRSIFKWKEKRFWSKEVSWQYAKKIFGYKLDAWHLFKSAMIMLMLSACVLYKPVISPFIDIIIFGAEWNIVFVLFYSKILKR